MKRILVLVLISFMCIAEEDILSDFTELVAEQYDTKAYKVSEETRFGDFTELVGKDWQSRAFSVISKIEKGKAIVTIIKDSAGPLYCVKQISLSERSKLVGHVRDVVASYIFESMNIPVNKVRIIPAEVNFPGKQYQNRLATLHTYVPGSNKSHDFPFPLRIAQYLKARVPMKDRGFTLRVIDDMSKDPDGNLVLMVAGDTFVSNPDRSSNNIFWDSNSGKFGGIDLELAYKLPLSRNLSEVACYQIEKCLKTPGFYLTKQQYQALELYNIVLQGLIEKNNPTDTCKLLQNIGAYAHIIFSNKADTITSDHSLREYNEKIHAQYNSSKKLVKLIDTLLHSLRLSKRRIRSH